MCMQYAYKIIIKTNNQERRTLINVSFIRMNSNFCKNIKSLPHGDSKKLSNAMFTCFHWSAGNYNVFLG